MLVNERSLDQGNVTLCSTFLAVKSFQSRFSLLSFASQRSNLYLSNCVFSSVRLHMLLGGIVCELFDREYAVFSPRISESQSYC